MPDSQVFGHDLQRLRNSIFPRFVCHVTYRACISPHAMSRKYFDVMPKVSKPQFFKTLMRGFQMASNVGGPKQNEKSPEEIKSLEYRRVRRYSFSPEIFRHIFKTGEVFEVTNGIPDDAIFRGFTHDPCTNNIVTFFEHPSFDPVHQSMIPPESKIELLRRPGKRS